MSQGQFMVGLRLVPFVFLGWAAEALAAPNESALVKPVPVVAQPKLAAATTVNAANASAEKLERQRQGIVELRLQNKTVALGFVLEGDGRIVTSLSAIGRGIGLTARYADGSSAPLRILHVDRAWDLALVSPGDQRWPKGFLASKRDPMKDPLPLRILRLDPAHKLRPAPLGVPRRENLTGGDAALLSNALTFSPTLQASDVGAPIVDDNGDVVAVASQACLPTILDRCVPIVYAVPTPELKRFIRDGASLVNSPLPWLGITVSSESSSTIPAVRVVAIAPNSPAVALGLRTGKQGDILLAVDGTPVGSPKDFGEVLHRHRAGDRVTLLLLAEGRYRELRVTLGRYPEAAKQAGSAQPDPGY